MKLPKDSADKAASGGCVTRLVRHSLMLLGIWGALAILPRFSFRYFNSFSDISLSDRYIAAVYLYALGFMLFEVIIKPSTEKTKRNILTDIKAGNENLVKGAADIAPLHDRREIHSHSLRSGNLQSERQVGMEDGDSDVYVESSPNDKVRHGVQRSCLHRLVSRYYCLI